MIEVGTEPPAESEHLPEGWRSVPLGTVIAEAQPGYATGERDPKGVMQLRMNNVDTRGNLDWTEFIRVPANDQLIAKYRLASGDVVFNNTNSTALVGKAALFDGHSESVVYSNHFTRLRTVSHQLDPRYLAAWLRHQWESGVFERICNRWIGQSAVKAGKLITLSIPLPPLEEQRRIASVLRQHMAAAEAARTAAEAQLASANDLARSYLTSVFRSPIVSSAPTFRIAEISQTSSGTTPSRNNQAYYGGTIPWIKTGELRDNAIHDSEEHVTDLALRETSLKLLPIGSLLIAMYGQGQTRGRTGLLAVSATTNQACFAIHPNPTRFDARYLQQWFRYSYQRLRQETEGRGGNQPNLNGDLLRQQVVPLPTVCQQEAMVADISRKLKASEDLKRSLESQSAALSRLPAALLRKAFAGEL